MLLVLLPTSFINCPVEVEILSCAMGFVLEPLSLVDVAVLVNQASYSMIFTVYPLTFVERAVDPDLSAFPMSNFEVFGPLPDVDCSI